MIKDHNSRCSGDRLDVLDALVIVFRLDQSLVIEVLHHAGRLVELKAGDVEAELRGPFAPTYVLDLYIKIGRSPVLRDTLVKRPYADKLRCTYLPWSSAGILRVNPSKGFRAICGRCEVVDASFH